MGAVEVEVEGTHTVRHFVVVHTVMITIVVHTIVDTLLLTQTLLLTFLFDIPIEHIPI